MLFLGFMGAQVPLRLFVNINTKEREAERPREGGRESRKEKRVRPEREREKERERERKNQSNTAELSDHMKLWIPGLSIQPLSAELCKSIQTDTKSKHAPSATIGN